MEKSTVQTFTTDAAIQMFKDGALLLFGEYRLSKGSHIAWRDKASGKQLEADVLVHTVESTDMSIAVNERLPEGMTPEARILELSLKKGQRCLVRIESIAVAKGLVQMRGTICKVEDKAAK